MAYIQSTPDEDGWSTHTYETNIGDIKVRYINSLNPDIPELILLNSTLKNVPYTGYIEWGMVCNSISVKLTRVYPDAKPSDYVAYITINEDNQLQIMYRTEFLNAFDEMLYMLGLRRGKLIRESHVFNTYTFELF